MAEFKVNARQLEEKADALADLNRKLRAEVEKMAGYERELSTMWEGDAQAAFRTSFQKDRAKMNAFAANIDKFVGDLLGKAEVYRRAEAGAVATAARQR